jgi:hypothetical protein
MGYESMQGSHGVSDARTTAGGGGLYCIDDYMQAMAVGWRIKEEGLIRWQRRDAAAATPSNLQAMGCLVQESGPFKVHQLKKVKVIVEKKEISPKGLSKEDEPFPCPNRLLSHHRSVLLYILLLILALFLFSVFFGRTFAQSVSAGGANFSP